MLSIIIPVYNYAAGIADSIRHLQNYLTVHVTDYEILLVNDGSRDNTRGIITTFLDDKRITLIDIKENQGKGAAIRQGILKSSGEHIIFTDADLPYDLGAIDLCVQKLTNGADVVLGSRHMPDSGSDIPTGVWRTAGSKIFLKLANSVLLEKVSDTQCGFKGFSRKAATDIFRHLTTHRFSFDVEIIYFAQTSGLRIVTVPVTLVRSQKKTTIGPWDMGQMIFDIMKMYVRYKILRK